MEKIKHRLIFHFYLINNFEDNIINRLHFNCLAYYVECFDEAYFYIAVDEDICKETISLFETKIINYGFLNVKFKIVQNTYYREAQTFKDEIADKLQEPYQGLTFFGHNKGITNIPIYGEEYVKKWVVGLYYLSLNDLKHVDDSFFNWVYDYAPVFYGSFLSHSDTIGDIYSGTFFWLNTNKLDHEIKQGIVKTPLLFDRTFAEIFPSIYKWENKNPRLYSKNLKIVYLPKYEAVDMDIALKFILSEEYNDSFIPFYKKMINNL